MRSSLLGPLPPEGSSGDDLYKGPVCQARLVRAGNAAITTPEAEALSRGAPGWEIQLSLVLLAVSRLQS